MAYNKQFRYPTPPPPPPSLKKEKDVCFTELSMFSTYFFDMENDFFSDWVSDVCILEFGVSLLMSPVHVLLCGVSVSVSQCMLTSL